MKLFRSCSARRTSFVFLPLLLTCIGRIHPAWAQWGNPYPPPQQPLGGSSQSQGWPQQQPGYGGGGAVGNPQTNLQDGYYVLTYPQGGSGKYPNPQGGGGGSSGGSWNQNQEGVMNPSAGLGEHITVDDKQQECTHQPRVAGGVNAQWNDAPFMVSLREINKDQYQNFGLGHFCGGTLMSPYFILTAASCLVNRQPREVGVVVGTLNRRKDRARSTQLLFVEKFVIHPSFAYETGDQDIGLIFLKQPVRLESHVKTATLAYQDPHAGTECTLFGWGQTSRHHQSLSECLQMAKVKVQDLAGCQRHFQQRHIKIPQMSFCAGHFGGGSDACYGDMGGPVMCDGILHGVINNRLGCGETDVGKVYTNVYSFRNWITYTIHHLQKEYKDYYPQEAFDAAMRAEPEAPGSETEASGSENGKRISLGLLAAAGLSLLFA